MIQKVEMYTVQCDNCKTTSGENADYSCWGDEAVALDEAVCADWIEHEGNHYCPDCYSIGDDDKIIINESRKDINEVKKGNYIQ